MANLGLFLKRINLFIEQLLLGCIDFFTTLYMWQHWIESYSPYDSAKRHGLLWMTQWVKVTGWYAVLCNNKNALNNKEYHTVCCENCCAKHFIHEKIESICLYFCIIGQYILEICNFFYSAHVIWGTRFYFAYTSSWN